MSDPRTAQLVEFCRASPGLMGALEFCAALHLDDWMLASGCVYQTVWNRLTGRPPDYGLKDYDLLYFDPDRSYDAEDRVIRRIGDTAPAPLGRLLEARNQARVHLWFPERFQEPYAPLESTGEALERFVAPAFAVGVRLDQGGALVVTAPFGLEDCFAMRLRPNPRRPIPAASFERVSASLRPRWPELQVTG